MKKASPIARRSLVVNHLNRHPSEKNALTIVRAGDGRQAGMLAAPVLHSHAHAAHAAAHAAHAAAAVIVWDIEDQMLRW